MNEYFIYHTAKDYNLPIKIVKELYLKDKSNFYNNLKKLMDERD